MIDAEFMLAAQAAFERFLDAVRAHTTNDHERQALHHLVDGPWDTLRGRVWTGHPQRCLDGPEKTGHMVARDLVGFLSTRAVRSCVSRPSVVVVATAEGVVEFAWRFDGIVDRVAVGPNGVLGAVVGSGG